MTQDRSAAHSFERSLFSALSAPGVYPSRALSGLDFLSVFSALVSVPPRLRVKDTAPPQASSALTASAFSTPVRRMSRPWYL